MIGPAGFMAGPKQVPISENYFVLTRDGKHLESITLIHQGKGARFKYSWTSLLDKALLFTGDCLVYDKDIYYWADATRSYVDPVDYVMY